MRSISYPQFRIVQSNTAEGLTEELNRALEELKEFDPDVTFEGLIARIAYRKEDESIPESLSEEYEAKGVNLCCEDCPYFERIKKKDGTDDLRKKIGKCPFAKNGISYKDSKACPTLFEMLNDGEVKLCLAD